MPWITAKTMEIPGSGHVAAEADYQAVTLVLSMLSDPSPKGQWRGTARNRIA